VACCWFVLGCTLSQIGIIVLFPLRQSLPNFIPKAPALNQILNMELVQYRLAFGIGIILAGMIPSRAKFFVFPAGLALRYFGQIPPEFCFDKFIHVTIFGKRLSKQLPACGITRQLRWILFLHEFSQRRLLDLNFAYSAMVSLLVPKFNVTTESCIRRVPMAGSSSLERAIVVLFHLPCHSTRA